MFLEQKKSESDEIERCFSYAYARAQLVPLRERPKEAWTLRGRFPHPSHLFCSTDSCLDSSVLPPQLSGLNLPLPFPCYQASSLAWAFVCLLQDAKLRSPSYAEEP